MVNKVITSSILKLIRHPDICLGNTHPISSQVVLTDRCNLDCAFCTAGGASRPQKSTVSIENIETTLTSLARLGCKGIEYTGGGEPTLHKDFLDIIDLTIKKGFSIGLITNGTTISPYSLKTDWNEFDWIRVSINAGRDQYLNVHRRNMYDTVLDGLSILSNTIPGKFGISYIYSDQPIDDLRKLVEDVMRVAPNIGYIRVGADIKKKGLDLIPLKATVSEFIKPFVDMQADRDLSIPSKCFMGLVKPCFDAYGTVYPCCIAQHRQFGSLGRFDTYEELFVAGKLPTIDTSKCPYCIYKNLNDFIADIVSYEVKNENFI